MTKRVPVPVDDLPMWLHVEGLYRARTRVVVYEDLTRGRMLTLRWRGPKNWKRRVLGRLLERDQKGEPLAHSIAWAVNEAKRKSVALSDGKDEPKKAVAMPFTIGETCWAIIDKKTGKYPHDSPFRKELLRAVDYAGIVWGTETPWRELDEDSWVELLRRRLEGLLKQGRKAVRTTEITVSRLITVTKWLRRTRRIPMDAALPPDDWKAQIVVHWKGETGSKRDPQPSQPRHTLAELRRILAVLDRIEPRVGLLIALGAEYRLGQVVRARRSDLNVEQGQLTVEGSGHKAGEIIDLTPRQVSAVLFALSPAGYLGTLEAAFQKKGADYLLFPGGKMTSYRVAQRSFGKGARLGAPLNRRTIGKHFRDAETLAKVKHVDGRGPYGLRRQNVDAALAEGVSELGLKAAGGWASMKIPTEIYAEKSNVIGRAEAMRIRTKTRGEE